MEAYPEEQRKYGMLNRLYVNLSSICSVILIIALLTTTQNKSLSHRIVVLVAGCFVLLHVNIMIEHIGCVIQRAMNNYTILLNR